MQQGRPLRRPANRLPLARSLRPHFLVQGAFLGKRTRPARSGLPERAPTSDPQALAASPHGPGSRPKRVGASRARSAAMPCAAGHGGWARACDDALAARGIPSDMASDIAQIIGKRHPDGDFARLQVKHVLDAVVVEPDRSVFRDHQQAVRHIVERFGNLRAGLLDFGSGHRLAPGIDAAFRR